MEPDCGTHPRPHHAFVIPGVADPQTLLQTFSMEP